MRTKRDSFSIPRVPRRRGSVVIYAFFLMVVMLGFISLGVDFGHVQSVKTELQRDADATAHSALQMVISYGMPTAQYYAPYLATNAYNPVDANSGQTPTVTVTWGSYDPVAKIFTAGGASPVAVKVVICRTTANGNPVPLTFPLVNGTTEVRKTCDVWAQAIAYIAGGQSGSVNVNSTASLYLAGMPAGSTTSGYGDNTTNAASYQMVCVPVTPGTYISFSNFSGATSIVPGYVPNSGPGGDTAITLHHGENYDHNPNPGYVNPENGIGDGTMYADAFCGVFLTNNAPTAASPPPAVDWTTSAVANQTTFTNLVKQQPFLIGNGQTPGGVTKQFLVPPGATRLYLSVWDGVCYNNNSGTMSSTVSVQQSILLAQ